MLNRPVRQPNVERFKYRKSKKLVNRISYAYFDSKKIRYTGEGLALGITDNIPNVKKSMENLMSNINVSDYGDKFQYAIKLEMTDVAFNATLKMFGNGGSTDNHSV